MSLHEVNQGIHKNKRPNRLGRGIGSGQGKTSGKGHKGQMARSGWKTLPIFQGGASPLVRRIPKRGFTNSFAMTVAEVNVSELEAVFESGATIGADELQAKGLIQRKFDVLKILGNGGLTKKFNITAHRYSASAKEKIEKAGGTAGVVPVKITVAEKKAAKAAASGKVKKSKS